jgi:hypothetical protein
MELNERGILPHQISLTAFLIIIRDSIKIKIFIFIFIFIFNKKRYDNKKNHLKRAKRIN